MNQKLQQIKNRYFRKTIKRPEGMITHHGDCKIYQSKETYGMAPCTCGLLHDLECLDWEVAELIYPDFGDELRESNMIWDEERTPMSKEDIEKLREVFGCRNLKTQVDIELITEVFGQDYMKWLQEN